ncbi:myotrophin-like [Branchiostoma floridae x Branchiostoma belcheri]
MDRLPSRTLVRYFPQCFSAGTVRDHQSADKMGDLVWSLKNGDIDLVKAAIDQPGFDVNSEIGGRMPIHYAADYGQLDIIKVLLEKGADVNKQDKHGISAVLAAIWEGHTECVKYLLEKGARKDGKAPDGTTYLDCAEREDIKSLLR